MNFIRKILSRTTLPPINPSLSETSPKEVGSLKDLKRLEKSGDKRYKSESEIPLKDSSENIVLVHKGNDSKVYQLMNKALENHFFFRYATKEQRNKLISNAFYVEVDQNKYFFREGEIANQIFVVDRGSVNIYHDNKLLSVLDRGKIVGDSCIYTDKHLYSAKTNGLCYFWVISHKFFHSVVQEIIRRDYPSNLQFLEQISFFKKMKADQRKLLASTLIRHEYKKNEIIINKDEPAMAFYIIKEGTVQIIKDGVVIKTLNEGEYFGEHEIYFGTARKIYAIAFTKCTCYAVGREALKQIFEGKLEPLVYRNIQKTAINDCELLSKFSLSTVEKIVDGMKISVQEQGAIILQRDLPCNQITIVLSGSMIKSKSGEVVCKEGRIYGTECLFESNKKKKMDDNIIMKTDGVIAMIKKDDIMLILNDEAKHLKTLERTKTVDSDTLSTAEDIMTLDDLIYIKKLYDSIYSSSHLVKYGENFYHLKVIPKKLIISYNIEGHINNELQINNTVFHPFISKYFNSFEDNKAVYIMREFINGMDLWNVIREIGLLSEIQAQFYIGSLILFLEYMHKHEIIYRGIDPSTIIIDENGYLKMTDFGYSKVLRPGNRTFTIIGTPHYVAPEIITGKGYTLNTDLWAVGVLLYEFLCGIVPYGAEAEDPYDIYQETLTKKLRFPNFVKARLSKMFAQQLLSRDPERRLGKSFAELKGNVWFSDFDFTQLESKTLKAPYIPPKQSLISAKELIKLSKLKTKCDSLVL